ncbi:DUF4129 domain-containing protein [Novipirellula artificiosorum]|nr:DUF4129 domain-containing protein [Novipirellula artificiosorum]
MLHAFAKQETTIKPRMMRMLLMLTLLNLCLPSIAASQDASLDVPPDTENVSLPSTPWYDAQDQVLIPVELKSSIDDTENRDSRWLPKAKRLVKPPDPVKSNSAGNSGSGWFGTELSIGNLFGWFLLVMIVVSAVGGLVYALSKTEIDLSAKSQTKAQLGPQSPDDQTIERMKHLPAELRRTDVNLKSEAERLMMLGHFDQAIILLFAHQLLLLDRAGILRLNRGKTNGKYVRETRAVDSELGTRLNETTDAFERSYFGRHSITASEFERLWTQNALVEQVVQTHHEVPA